MSSDVHETSPYEREIGRRVEDRKRPHRIAEQDVRALFESLGPERHGEAAAPAQGRDPLSPLGGVSGNQDEAASGDLSAHPRDRGKDHLLLTLMRASGGPDSPVHPAPVAQKLSALTDGGRYSDVELGVSGDHHPVRRDPGCDQPIRILAGLSRDCGHSGEGRREEAVQSAVAGRGSHPEASVDADEWNRSRGTGVNEVRPELGLEHDDRAGGVVGEKPPNRVRKVPRQVALRDPSGEPGLALPLARWGARGQEERTLAAPLQHEVEQRKRGLDLSDRHRVHDDPPAPSEEPNPRRSPMFRR